MDRRTTASNGRVAALSLQGQVTAERFVRGRPARICVPVADLLCAPDGARDRQLLFGAGVQVYEIADDRAFVQADADGYVGYVRAAELRDAEGETHWVSAPATHLYEAADFKSPNLMCLSFGSRITATGHDGAFVKTADGYLPACHLAETGRHFDDPAQVAEMFLGTPYLWGGNSRGGIDCSGLVQAACTACGLSCPGDSDMQARDLGTPLGDKTPLARNDLLFWKGHVALVCDPQTLIHANAHHMAVMRENTAAAIARIRGQGDGTITHRKRLPPVKGALS